MVHGVHRLDVFLNVPFLLGRQLVVEVVQLHRDPRCLLINLLQSLPVGLPDW